MDTKISKKKVQINLMLDSEIVEWIISEAKENDMSLDEVVESLVMTIRCMSEVKDLLTSEAANLSFDNPGGNFVS